MRIAVTIIILFSITLLVCESERDQERNLKPKGHDDSPIAFFDECQVFEIKIDSLPLDQRDNIAYRVSVAEDSTITRDSEGLVMFDWNGQVYYHPILLARHAINHLNGFRQTGDSSHLEMVRKYIDRLVDEADDYGGALYFAYRFDYEVHSRKAWELKAPWYSGMAQGEILKLLVRMFVQTGDSLYLDYSRRAFDSFRRLKGKAVPWVVFIDRAGCFWIEEYPLPSTTMTLNGFIFAIYGVYEYYLLTGDKAAEEVLTGSLNTIKNYLPLFRRPGQPSYYNLILRHYAWDYHLTHIRQLRYLELLTGDDFFGAWADTLEADYSL